ncbi:MAG TPA: phosphatase PAP2 family protein [Patescibacteria group bacterium]|nr:phosphatase PAP2 family protein [Patescibacteria group bacterium]
MTELFRQIADSDMVITKTIIQFPHTWWSDGFFAVFSVKGMSVILWLVIGGYFLIVERKRNKNFLFCFIAALIVSFLLYTGLKAAIKRPRPLINYNQLGPVSASYPRDYAFPSGHATIAFAAATVLSFFDRKRTWFFYTVAVLVATSRVYLGYHYVLDTVAGFLLGTIISQLILIPYVRYTKKN